MNLVKKIEKIENSINTLITDKDESTLQNSTEYLAEIGFMLNRLSNDWNKKYKQQLNTLSNW